MGTGHSIDTPIRVAPFGINSVISVVDDLLIEKIRKHYAQKFNLPFNSIPRKDPDGRAKRITAYLDLVQEIVQTKFEEIRNQPYFQNNEKAKFFDLLPDGNHIKQKFNDLINTDVEALRLKMMEELNQLMHPGSVDVNIMAKVDRLGTNKQGEPMSAEFSDANAALRGFAQSSLSSSIVLSAGFNPRLYGYLSEFKDFYRDASGNIKKKIILKVSDFRSALIQGKFLAKKGLEVFEYRIESGLNCGGHAFASDGLLLPSLLKEFREKKEMLSSAIQPLIEKYYETEKGGFNEEWSINIPKLTVQGGIGTAGEAKRLLEDFDMDETGWGSPFLLVPEATPVDEPTRRLLQEAKEEDLFLSGVSPLGVPFNNIRRTGSEQWHKERIAKGKPGSQCPKGFLESNTEFTEEPICTASIQYQLLKLDQIQHSDLDKVSKEKAKETVLDKACLCEHLGNGALISLGIAKLGKSPQAICPGPNIAWFDRNYSLKEMVNHIYGRGKSLVSDKRPHMFAKEIVLYVEYFEKLVDQFDGAKATQKKLSRFVKNLEEGMDYCLELAGQSAYKDENLSSIPAVVEKQREKLRILFEQTLEPEMAV